MIVNYLVTFFNNSNVIVDDADTIAVAQVCLAATSIISEI